MSFDRNRLSPLELLNRIRESGLTTPEEAADIIRRDRDARS